MRKLFLVLVALLSACAAPAPAATPVLRAPVEPPLPAPSVMSALPTAPSSTQATLALTIRPVATNVRVTDTNEYEFPQLLPFDGEAKAYPVTVLRFREMVDDELAGIPILVTW